MRRTTSSHAATPAASTTTGSRMRASRRPADSDAPWRGGRGGVCSELMSLTAPHRTAPARPKPRGNSRHRRRRFEIPRPRLGGVDADLGADAAGPRRHHHHALRQIHRLEHRMGDEDDGLAQVAPQRQQIVVEAKAGDLVQRRERLVHQQDVRVGDQRARQRQPASSCRRTIRADRRRRIRQDPTRFNAASTRPSASAAGTCASFSGSRTFSRTLVHGIRVGS